VQKCYFSEKINIHKRVRQSEKPDSQRSQISEAVRTQRVAHNGGGDGEAQYGAVEGL
jgi:hypothetical protein